MAGLASWLPSGGLPTYLKACRSPKFERNCLNASEASDHSTHIVCSWIGNRMIGSRIDREPLVETVPSWCLFPRDRVSFSPMHFQAATGQSNKAISAFLLSSAYLQCEDNNLLQLLPVRSLIGPLFLVSPLPNDGVMPSS